MSHRQNLLKHDQWKALVKDWESSGKSANAWCQERSISINTFRYWKNKFFSQKIDKKAFTEITEEEFPGITIRYNGFEMDLHEKFDEKALSRCLAVMRSSLC